jgi:arsenate reductase (thioredoxin)
MKILFVCKENVGRSQIAQTIYTNLTGDACLSAATNVNIEQQEIGERPLAAPVIELMKKEGVDISKNKSKQITQQMIKEATKIIVMTKDMPYFLLNNKKVTHWPIIDPSGKTTNELKETIEYIRKKIKKLIPTKSTN